MLYLAIVILSICSCAVGFLLEVTESSILHVQNGRPPKAGVALFPNIPMVQLTYLLAAWGLNQVSQNLGHVVLPTFAFVSIAARLWRYRRSSAQLKSLIATSNASAIKVPAV
jgi:hypothetical protein